MELYFNELSLDCSIPVEYAFITNLKEVYIRSKKEGFSICRFSASDRQAIFDYLQSNPRLKNIRNIMDFAYGFFASPYETSYSELQETQFIESNWNYQGKTCGGLAWAYIYDTLSLSIANDNWLLPETIILRDLVETRVRHVSIGNHFDFHHDWLQANKEIVLIACDILAVDKTINLRDDHGKNILQDFSKKIRRNKYVISILNSLPFNPNCRSFIKQAKPDGIVEIVLPWTDRGIGLAVQTTGRNYRETQKIATILDEEFGHR
ncbi:MAG: hypothetical protein WCR13_07010 [Sphaerochaeta sp.]